MAEAEVRETFKVPRIGTVAGCFVRSGTATRTARVRVIRDGIEIYEGTVASLRRFKEDVREVREGFECGIGIENFNDVKVGDVIEFYRTAEVARTLESSPAQACARREPGRPESIPWSSACAPGSSTSRGRIRSRRSGPC
jgi:translation initiation factor IF-2